MKSIICVNDAGSIRTPGFGRVELAIASTVDPNFESENGSSRELRAAVYTVAARLEQMGADEGLEFSVSVAQAQLGVIDVDFRRDAVAADIIDEMLIEACADCGFLPIDALVESGAINPSDRDDGVCRYCGNGNVVCSCA